MALRKQALFALAILIGLASGCEAQPVPGSHDTETAVREAEARSAKTGPKGPVSVPLTLRGRRLHLELAADPVTRMRGLGGRRHIPEGSGMLFSFRRSAPRQFLMRDCVVPIDIAFLDAEGRVTAVHTMPVEPPRRPDETPLAYEERLPLYGSGDPAQFAVETAGGALVDAGVQPGDVAEFDRAAVLRRTR